MPIFAVRCTGKADGYNTRKADGVGLHHFKHDQWTLVEDSDITERMTMLTEPNPNLEDRSMLTIVGPIDDLSDKRLESWSVVNPSLLTGITETVDPLTALRQEYDKLNQKFEVSAAMRAQAETELEALKATYEAQSVELAVLHDAHDAMKEKHKDLEAENRELHVQLQGKDSTTPPETVDSPADAPTDDVPQNTDPQDEPDAIIPDADADPPAPTKRAYTRRQEG